MFPRKQTLAKRGVLAATLAVVVVVGTIISIAAFHDEAPPPPSIDAPAQELRITCRDGAASVENPRVLAQPDGVHYRVESNLEGASFSIFVGDSAWVNTVLAEDSTGQNDVQPFPPGQASVQCAYRQSPSGAAVPFEVVDRDGIWHHGNLACEDWTELDPSEQISFPTKGNPLPDTLYRALPGVRPGDRLSYVGYPDEPGWIYRIMRDGSVVAYVELQPYGGRTVVGFTIVCPGSGIGVGEA